MNTDWINRYSSRSVKSSSYDNAVTIDEPKPFTKYYVYFFNNPKKTRYKALMTVGKNVD